MMSLTKTRIKPIAICSPVMTNESQKSIIKSLIIVSIALAFMHTDIFGQRKLLVLNKPLHSEISSEKPDSFYIKMTVNQFASLRVTEKNVRVFVEVFNPYDSLIMIVDENQMGDKEVVSFFSKAAGYYKIKVLWGFIKPLSGK